MGSTTARLLVLAGLAASLTACSIDPAKVEASIRADLDKRGVETQSVTCPGGQRSKKDGTFVCTGKSAAGDDFKVNVTMTDDQGAIRWVLVGKVMDPKAYAAVLAQKLGGSFDCGTKPFIAVKGTKMVCKFNGKEAPVVFKNDDGEVDGAEFGRIYAESVGAE